MERRRHTRYLVNWKVSIVNDHDTDEQGQSRTYHGRAYEISESGMSILTHHNIYFTHHIIVLVSVPSMVSHVRNSIVEIRSGMKYTVYSGERMGFKTGIIFLEYKNDGLKILRSRLSEMHSYDPSDIGIKTV